MSEDFGSDFITIVDDDGTEFELEVLDTMDYNGKPIRLSFLRIWTRTIRITA